MSADKFPRVQFECSSAHLSPNRMSRRTFEARRLLEWKDVAACSISDCEASSSQVIGCLIFHGQFAQCRFSELPPRFAAVATALASRDEIWLRDGKVSDAVRAACTVPGCFSPCCPTVAVSSTEASTNTGRAISGAGPA